MPKQKIKQTFDGGLAGDIQDWFVPNNMLVDCRNFLFERRELRTRPGARSGNSALGAGSIIDSIMPMFPPIGGSSPQMYGTYKVNQSDASFRVFRLDPLYAASSSNILMPPTEVATATPAGLNGGFYANCVQYEGKTYIYGAYDAGNVPQLVQIDNNSHAAAAIALPGAVGVSAVRFHPFPICVHLSRVFIADPGIPTLSFPTIYWSKIGDPTVWTGDFTTGNVRLQEASDGIRGMGVMQNLILIGRPTGFHVGMPTGNGSNPYDWKAITRFGIGPVYPESFCIFGDMCFFAGQDDIYVYDLNTVESIGAGISNEIFFNAQVFGMGIRMFVTTGYDWRRTPQLHVLNIYTPSTYIPGGGSGTIPTMDVSKLNHMVYDLVEKKWSRHSYDAAASDTFPYEGVSLTWDAVQIGGTNNGGARNTYQRPCIIRRPPAGTSQYLMWDNFAPFDGCDSTQYFQTGAFVINDDTSIEGRLLRFLIAIRGETPTPFNVTVDIDYDQGRTHYTDSATFTVNSTGRYERIWINKLLVGNFFQFKFTFPANTSSQIREIVFEFDTDTQEARV